MFKTIFKENDIAMEKNYPFLPWNFGLIIIIVYLQDFISTPKPLKLELESWSVCRIFFKSIYIHYYLIDQSVTNLVMALN